MESTGKEKVDLNPKPEPEKAVKENCNFCGSSETRLLRCARCKKAFYCNQNHQRSHWATHKPNCIPTAVAGTSSSTLQNERTLTKPGVITPNPNVPPINGFYHKSQFVPLYALRDFDMNVDDYAITGSPAIVKVSQDEVLGKERIKKYAEIVVKQMISEGYCVIDNFLGEMKCGKVLWDVTTICRSGIMKPGQVVVPGKNKLDKVRGDVITWITGQEEAYENMGFIMNEVDRLIRYCKGRLGNIKGRTPAMVACYPGDGTGYKRHIDNTLKDGRCLSCLYYLNKGWEPKDYGGQLRLFPNGRAGYFDIEPIFDRLTIFWSDRRTPHEVLPAYHQRYAVTLWYFDASEREVVKEKYFSNLKNAFANNVSVKETSTSKPEKNEGEQEEECYERVPTNSSKEEDPTDDDDVDVDFSTI